jgi:Electron transfer DM13
LSPAADRVWPSAAGRWRREEEMGMSRTRRRRRTGLLVASGGLVIALIVGVLVWFQPQKLLINHRVDEPLPVAGASLATANGGSQAGLPSTQARRAPVILAVGAFRSLGHPTSGRAEVLDLGDGRRFLRLLDLDTSNGPDLFVYLSVTPTGGKRDTFDDNFVSLGRLKGNLGNQNYEIAAGVDLRRYRSVVIWCRRFTYAFGAAPLR